ncbi:GAF domain-containing protein [Roseivirga sp. BDSF3-8]|uniref:GAF domain-containing protein n=1 Tax=Roseivirga sp. BDSF3-8 TaxID=3241598 RepID=UPI003531C5C1
MNLTRITNIGTNEGLPDYLNNKIRLSNGIALLIIGIVALPFVGISLIHFPGLTWIPVAGGVVCAAAMAMNAVGLPVGSRFLLSILPVILATVYHAYLIPQGEKAEPSIMMIMVSFTFLPLVLFDLRERIPLILSTVIAASCVLGIQQVIDTLETDLDITVLREGYLNPLSMVLGLAIGLSLVVLMSIINKRSEDRINTLIGDMNRRNRELEESEDDMKKNLTALQEAREVEKQRSWASEGLALLSGIWRDASDLQTAGDRLISEIVKYMGMNQGGLFTVNYEEDGSEPRIKLLSCYAYGRKKFMEKEFAPGQGLLGQAYLEQDYIHLTETPKNYINITSGLGEATPKSILIVPMMVNERVEGLLELAGFSEFEQHHIDFLMQLGENLAAFISSEKLNERTRALLLNVQSQAEEMRSQEEEMRQNMEELQATQEEMQRKEREYLDRIAELEGSSESAG